MFTMCESAPISVLAVALSEEILAWNSFILIMHVAWRSNCVDRGLVKLKHVRREWLKHNSKI
jgi:hypothetical protein